MKTCEYTEEVEMDLALRFGEQADLHPAVGELFAMLGEYDSGCVRAANMVEVLETGNRVAHLVTGGRHPFMLVVTFKENETTRTLLRLHAVTLGSESAA